MKPGTVGQMRQQSALADADTPIVLVSKNNAVLQLIRGLKVVRVYPDTTDAEGNWSGTFKIEVDES
ncbi:MAG TPA: hypothetical protein VGY48_15905 [Vicinamibacterales bacterium]|jgi:hypothetical protein|nr:hypothetical protein [Vicinamibacterales bacterium]